MNKPMVGVAVKLLHRDRWVDLHATIQPVLSLLVMQTPDAILRTVWSTMPVAPIWQSTGRNADGHSRLKRAGRPRFVDPETLSFAYEYSFRHLCSPARQ
jgi:hypothetical protein